MLLTNSIRIIGFAVAITVLAGCGDSLEGLVRVGRQPRPTAETVLPFEGQAQLKISPGHQVAVSPDNMISMEAHITATDRFMVDGSGGGQLSAMISIGRYRSNEQGASSLRAPSAVE